jgi:hypothetical protein
MSTIKEKHPIEKIYYVTIYFFIIKVVNKSIISSRKKCKIVFVNFQKKVGKINEFREII